MRGVVAVCAAEAEDFYGSIAAGRELADRAKAPLVLLLTQSPGEARAQSLEKAMELARRYDAELHVRYTEHAEETVRELVDYCRARDLEVIPEQPTLSHSDYILYKGKNTGQRVPAGRALPV